MKTTVELWTEVLEGTYNMLGAGLYLDAQGNTVRRIGGDEILTGTELLNRIDATTARIKQLTEAKSSMIALLARRMDELKQADIDEANKAQTSVPMTAVAKRDALLAKGWRIISKGGEQWEVTSPSGKWGSKTGVWSDVVADAYEAMQAGHE